MTLDHDYETEPIGGDNPYYRCVHCKRSDPEINGRVDRHESWCKYRIAKESGQAYRPFAEEPDGGVLSESAQS